MKRALSLVAALLLLAACEMKMDMHQNHAPAQQKMPEEFALWEYTRYANLRRAELTEDGVVCYLYPSNTMSCVKVR